ncbi:helix-turn-helix domain-containing protein [Mycobacterium riyadhense]|uniref:XRE family transcriptional regulator n=2 Tax=Mycobacterium riyadhense TaxID=486698 RepID=A0A1X2B3V0_9MYCO|nr:helix-turn-helix transcriptional regulator [Mycobacterium riyadhense]ORW58291.1 XRE family transcriptional regulator [Mycobacterium riyadhense]
MSGGAPGNGDAQASSDLAVKLRRLFDIVRRPNEPPMSNQAAVEKIKDKTGVAISATYLWQLRNGSRTNPTVQHVRALAKFFGVPTAYLVDNESDHKIEAQLGLLVNLRDSGVRDLAARASGLTPEALRGVAAMIDAARKMEHLPPIAQISGEV